METMQFYERPDYNAMKIAATVVKDGVKYILRGDPKRARDMLDEGKKQYGLMDLVFHDKDIGRRSAYVDTGKGAPVEIISSKNGLVKEVVISAPPMITDVVIDKDETPDIPLTDWYNYPGICYKFIGNGYYDPKLWWAAEGLTWRKPMFHKFTKPGSPELFWRVHGYDGIGEWSKTFLALREVGHHVMYLEYDSSNSPYRNDWSPGYMDFPDPSELFGAPVNGPNLAGTYWLWDAFCIEECFEPCPICKVRRDDTLYAYTDEAGNQSGLVTKNRARCGGGDVSGLFGVFYWRSGFNTGG